MVLFIVQLGMGGHASLEGGTAMESEEGITEGQ
jgi:hypothetical protein